MLITFLEARIILHIVEWDGSFSGCNRVTAIGLTLWPGASYLLEGFGPQSVIASEPDYQMSTTVG